MKNHRKENSKNKYREDAYYVEIVDLYSTQNPTLIRTRKMSYGLQWIFHHQGLREDGLGTERAAEYVFIVSMEKILQMELVC